MDQAAVAIERVRLVEDLDRVRRTAETDRLRSALLTSISHDLKTPLAAVLRAAGTLRSMSDALDEHAKADLVATISTVQLERARALLDAMKAETIPLGERLITEEANLEQAICQQGITPETLSPSTAGKGRPPQTEVAAKLGKVQSFVSCYEKGLRRLDVIEFLDVAQVVGADPVKLIRILMEFPTRT